MATSSRTLTTFTRLLHSRQRAVPNMAIRKNGIRHKATIGLQTRSFTTNKTRLASSSSSSTTENPSAQRAAQKDREKMSVEPNETSKSMTDTDAAQQDEAAYDTNTSDPQSAKEKAGQGKDVNPLDASPANPEISQQTEEAAGGPGKKVGEGSDHKSSGGSTTAG